MEKVKKTLLTHKPIWPTVIGKQACPPAPEPALDWTVNVPHNLSSISQHSPVKPVYTAPQEKKMFHLQSNKPSFMDMDSYNMDDKLLDIKDSEETSEELDVFIEDESTPPPDHANNGVKPVHSEPIEEKRPIHNKKKSSLMNSEASDSDNLYDR